MRQRDVVTCFLARGGRVLVLRRSARVRTYPGRWAGVSGTMEGPDARAEALREVAEETGLSPPAVRVVRGGPALDVADAALGLAWRVHPVLAEVAEGAEPRLNWENDEARWVLPRELLEMRELDAVPGFAAAWRRVAP